jgi:hypothetical protein
MPKKIKRLSARGGKIVAYDDQLRQFFLVKLEPLDLADLEKDEAVEAVRFALCGGAPDVVIEGEG